MADRVGIDTYQEEILVAGNSKLNQVIAASNGTGPICSITTEGKLWVGGTLTNHLIRQVEGQFQLQVDQGNGYFVNTQGDLFKLLSNGTTTLNDSQVNTIGLKDGQLAVNHLIRVAFIQYSSSYSDFKIFDVLGPVFTPENKKGTLFGLKQDSINVPSDFQRFSNLKERYGVEVIVPKGSQLNIEVGTTNKDFERNIYAYEFLANGTRSNGANGNAEGWHFNNVHNGNGPFYQTFTAKDSDRKFIFFGQVNNRVNFLVAGNTQVIPVTESPGVILVKFHQSTQNNFTTSTTMKMTFSPL